MGQAEILKFLKKQYELYPDRYFSRKEICEGIGIEFATKWIDSQQTKPLRQLAKYGFLDGQKVSREVGGLCWVYKYVPKELRDVFGTSD